MASNLVLTLFFFAIPLVCFAEESSGVGGAADSTLPCVPKLLPCQASLVSHSTNPPATCCVPLKQIIEDDAKCLCDVFNTPAILKGLNITQDDGLNLAKNCHAQVDLSVCKTTPGNPPSPPASSNSSSSTATTPSSSKSAAIGLEAMVGETAAISIALFLLLSTVGFI